MDLLMAAKNAVAADAVALAVAGFVPQEQEQIRLCAEMGLGPGRLDEIEVRGESIESVHFDLQRLHDNVLELPIPFCLDRISLGELELIAKGLRMHGFLEEGPGAGSTRGEMMATLFFGERLVSVRRRSVTAMILSQSW